MILQAVVALVRVRVHAHEIPRLLELCALSATTRFGCAACTWTPRLGRWLPFCCGKMLRRGSRRQWQFVRRFVPWAVARARSVTALRARSQSQSRRAPDRSFEAWAAQAVKGGVRWWIDRHIAARWRDVAYFYVAIDLRARAGNCLSILIETT